MSENKSLEHTYKEEADEAEVWSQACSENSISGYSNYLCRFSNGVHAAEAKSRIEKLKLAQQADINMQIAVGFSSKSIFFASERSYENFDNGVILYKNECYFVASTRDAITIFDIEKIRQLIDIEKIVPKSNFWIKNREIEISVNKGIER